MKSNGNIRVRNNYSVWQNNVLITKIICATGSDSKYIKQFAPNDITIAVVTLRVNQLFRLIIPFVKINAYRNRIMTTGIIDVIWEWGRSPGRR